MRFFDWVAALIVVAVITFVVFVVVAPDSWFRTEEGRYPRTIVKDIRKAEAPDVAGAFQRYQKTEILWTRILEDPVDRKLALGTTTEEMSRLRHETAQKLVWKLEECLAKKEFFSEPLCYTESLEGGFLKHFCDLGDEWSTVKEIERIVDATGALYDIKLRDQALDHYARREGPRLRQQWLKTENGEWGDAAGCLWALVACDQVPPSKLGLSPSETFQLLELEHSLENSRPEHLESK